MSYGSVSYASTPYASQGGGLNEVVATGIALGFYFEEPALAQTHNLEASDIVFVFGTGQPALGQYLEADDIVYEVRFEETQILLEEDLVYGHYTGQPALGQVHALVADGLVYEVRMQEVRAGTSLIWVDRGEWYNPLIWAVHGPDNEYKPVLAGWVTDADGVYRKFYFGS